MEKSSLNRNNYQLSLSSSLSLSLSPPLSSSPASPQGSKTHIPATKANIITTSCITFITKDHCHHQHHHCHHHSPPAAPQVVPIERNRPFPAHRPAVPSPSAHARPSAALLGRPRRLSRAQIPSPRREKCPRTSATSSQCPPFPSFLFAANAYLPRLRFIFFPRQRLRQLSYFLHQTL